MLSRRGFIIGGAALALVLSLPGAGAADDAAGSVQAFYDALQKTLAAEPPADPKARVAAIGNAVRQAFDLGAMTRLAVGSRWRTIPPEKQQKLQEAFGRYFVASYANSFGRAKGARFEVTPASEARPGGRLVKSRVLDPAGKPTEVNYLVSAEGKIVDIYFSGTVSELAAYRTDFERVLAKGGADALEADLNQRADKLVAK